MGLWKRLFGSSKKDAPPKPAPSMKRPLQSIAAASPPPAQAPSRPSQAGSAAGTSALPTEESTTPTIRRLLKSLSARDGWKAAKDLVALGAIDEMFAHLRQMQDETIEYRQVASSVVDGLSISRDTRATPALLNLLSNTRDQHLFERIVGCLGSLRDGRAAPVLYDRFLQSSLAVSVRQRIALAIIEIGWKAPTAGERITVAVAARRYKTAAEEGPQALPALMEALNAEINAGRGYNDAVDLINAIGEVHDAGAVGILIRCLGYQANFQGVHHIRRAAARALAKLPDRSIAGALIKLIGNCDQGRGDPSADAALHVLLEWTAPGAPKLSRDDYERILDLKDGYRFDYQWGSCLDEADEINIDCRVLKDRARHLIG